MKIIIDVGHPAHVHLFRNAAKAWINKGHQVLFTTRDRKPVPELIESFGFDYRIISRTGRNQIGLLFELLQHDFNLLKLTREFKANILIGTSISITHVSKITKAISIVFNEDDIDYLKSFSILAYPFADRIVTPDCLRDKRTSKYVTYNSYHELAYLHPKWFSPDKSILKELNINENEKYFVLRFVAFNAHHDVGKKGISEKLQRKLVNLLLQYGKVFITSENPLPQDLQSYGLKTQPEKIHSVLSFASMFISDSQTMTIEAAVLGIPSIRINTFVGLCSVIEELQYQYNLTYGFLPEEEDQMINKVEELLNQPSLKTNWEKKRNKLLEEKIDLSNWIIDFVENNSIIRKNPKNNKY